MLSIKGIVIQSGLRIGKARKILPQRWDIRQSRITQQEIGIELKKLHDAVATVEKEIELHLDGFTGTDQDKDILRSHLLILHDPEILPHIQTAIGTGLLSAALAVQNTFAEVLRNFKSLKNDFFAQRAADYKDIEQHLLAAITGQKNEDLDDWQPDQIAVVSEISPSQVTGFARHHIPAYCSEQGSFTSHASILSRSLHISAIVGAQNLCDQVHDGDILILDGIEGQVIINPDQPTQQLYEQLLDKYLEQEEITVQNTELPAQTLDGRDIKLRCNLDLLSEIAEPNRLGASGIGLYRTEFLYLGKDELPSEELQYEIYREVAEKVAPHSVTIRSFDLGGDKLSHLIPSPAEENPYLGSRGIRFSLAHPDIFRTQIRAVLRASSFGKIKLMFPMVADLKDFQQAKDIVQECKAQLSSEGIPYDHDLSLGVMIEIPSAALSADELAQACDFLSIGTNDLVQYTLATDRNNSSLAAYYTTHHPAVLQLLKLTLDAAVRHNKPVSVCGEMASQPEYTPLLIGMGFHELSVRTSSFSQCKSIIRRCDAALTELVSQTKLSGSLADIEELIFHKLKPYYQL